MSDQLKVPQTTAEIEAAREFLRNAFARCSENFECYLKSNDFARDVELAKGVGMTEEDWRQEAAEDFTSFQKKATVVASGSPEGEKIIENTLKLWQKRGSLPFLLKPY